MTDRTPRREGLPYPARLPGVIAVGSHDGNGRPTDFSNNGPGVDLLADGEGVPQSRALRDQLRGTAGGGDRDARAGDRRGPDRVDDWTPRQMIDVLQQGGAGPLSRPDPADGRSRYFLHDHDGSLDYAWSHYGGTPTRALEYVASHRT